MKIQICNSTKFKVAVTDKKVTNKIIDDVTIWLSSISKDVYLLVADFCNRYDYEAEGSDGEDDILFLFSTKGKYFQISVKGFSERMITLGHLQKRTFTVVLMTYHKYCQTIAKAQTNRRMVI